MKTKLILIIILTTILVLILISAQKCEKWTQNLTATSPETCYNTLALCNAGCTGWRFTSGICASGPSCLPGEDCYSTLEGCVGNNVNGYRCAENCMQGSVCGSKTGDNGNTCHGSRQNCVDACPGYRCSEGCNQSNIPCTNQEISVGQCYQSRTPCTQSCDGYRCTQDCSIGDTCADGEQGCFFDKNYCLNNCKPSSILDCGDSNRERGWYDFSHFNQPNRTFSRIGGPYNDYCRWVGSGQFACKLAGSQDDYTKNPDGSIKDYGAYMNNLNEPLVSGQTNCSVKTVFDRINNNENILYKLFNAGKTLQGISGTKTYVIEIIRGSTKPELFWKLVGSNNEYYFYNMNNQVLMCRPELGGICEDDVDPQPEGKIRIIPSSNAIERAKGICTLQSLSAVGWLSVDSSNDVVKVTSNQDSSSAVWTIVPYSLNKVPLF